MSRRHSRSERLLIWAAATDSTFQWWPSDERYNEALIGKCIHCRCTLTVELIGKRRQIATVEHIVPKHHGGTDELTNLAVACAKCNNGKGVRLDHRRADDPTLQKVIATLQERRRERWREPEEGWTLPPRPDFVKEDSE